MGTDLNLEDTALPVPELNDVLFTFSHSRTLLCNRFLLAARSPVFKAMLFGHMMEANSENPEINITDSSLEAFIHFIHFIYTDSIDKDMEVPLIHQVLRISRKYCFSRLQHECETRIRQLLSPQNAGTYCLEAYTNGDFDLVPMCLQVIADSFAKTPASEIAKLPLECMKLLVQADDTRAAEIDIFQACVAWSQSRSQEDIRCIVPLIRFQNMTPSHFAKHVVPSGLLPPERMLDIMVAGTCGTLTRNPRQHTTSVFVMGGFGNDGCDFRSLDVAYELDTETSSCKRLPNMNTRRMSTQGCVCRGVLYCIGGSDLSSTETMNLSTKEEWVMSSSMSQPRRKHSVCSLRDKVYAIGGFNGASGDALAAVEVLDPDMNQWMHVSPMNTARYSCSACVLDGKIFVTGGQDSQSKPLSSVECYDPDSDSWSVIAPMLAERYQHASCAFGGKLFVFGGIWTELAPMPVPRASHGCVVWGDSILVCGGCSSGSTNSCDIYHPSSNTWERAPFTLPMKMANFAMCGGAGL